MKPKTKLSPSAFKKLHKGCQAEYIAIKNNEWVQVTTAPMLIGAYVDAYFSGRLDKFKLENSELVLTKKGDLRSDFVMANDIIEAIKSDKFFLNYLTGEQQREFNGVISGVPYHGFTDFYIPQKAIVDLKIVKSIKEKIWNNEMRIKQNFIETYGYIYDAAIYQELVYQETGESLPFFIAAVSKEKGFDKEVIYIPQDELNKALDEVKEISPYYYKIRTGKHLPMRCESCEYCRTTKRLTETVNMYDL